MIQRATLTHGTSSKKPVFLEASAESLPFDDHRFDLVCAIGFIEYFADPDPPMREIARVLKPGGTLVMQSFQKDVFRRIASATGMDAVKRVAKALYSAVSNTPVPAGFGVDKPYSQAELDALMKRFQLVKIAHVHNNYLLLPKTIRRVFPSASVVGSEIVTRSQPGLLSGFAVNYVGRYRLQT